VQRPTLVAPTARPIRPGKAKGPSKAANGKPRVATAIAWFLGKQPKKAGVAEPKPDDAGKLAAWLQVQSYRTIGRHLESESPHLTASLDQAGFSFSPGLYRGLMVCAGTAGFLVFGLIGAVFLSLSLGPLGIAYGILAGAAAGGLSAAAFPFVVRSRIQNRSHAIDKELPFALSELSVLAGIGLSPIVLMRRMATRTHDPATTAAFRQVAAMVDTEGRDLVTAMAETARKSPSDALRTTLWDMANLMHQGGDLETYLKGQSETVLEDVRASQKSFTEQLGTYADMYISIVLLGILFLAVGAFILDAFRSTAGPLTASALLLVLTWGLGPLVVIVLGLLLSSAHGSSNG
jgi:pilus assembly protein TadC